jgi:CDP-diacylglycerol--glycerol-3-phosphate 3-phosphatidyltransferase
MKMNLPNKLSILRILLIPVIIILGIIESIDFSGNALRNELLMEVTLGNLLILVIFCIASFTDFLDGHIARKNNIVTDFGKFIDPLADKLLVCSTMIYLIEIGRFEFFGFSWGFVVTLIIAREFAVTGLRLIAANKEGKVMAAKMLGKMKTVVQMFMIIILLLNSFTVDIIGFVFVLAALALTIISGVDYFLPGWMLASKFYHIPQ